MRLVEPSAEFEAAFRDMAAEWRASGIDRFAAYVQALEAQKDPDNVPPDWVPSTTFWLVTADGRVVGTSRLRHWLVPHLELEGGNIGYDVRPSERGKGYGTALLALTLEKARDLGLDEVLVTCDTDNLASVRVIEKNGGRLVGQGISDESGKLVNRYQIALDR
ncbi:MAG: GNAT family N-acetyltransferase [Anaerolineae bacterium]